MSAYLFVWNPNKWKWTHLEQQIEELQNNGKTTERWSCRSYKRIKPGDRAFLGMAAAYELSKLGYRCMILEARNRAGGRCFSVRKGSTNIETGQPLQTANFDEGQYFNAGPSRIPHHHVLTLHYCKESGVPIQVYNNVNEAAYYFSEGEGPLSNRKVRMREVHNDVRGWLCELLAKGMDGGKIDTQMSREDTQRVIEYLRERAGGRQQVYNIVADGGSTFIINGSWCCRKRRIR